jgi:hypothetical protein
MSPAEFAAVDRLPNQTRTPVVSDELNRIMTMVVDACSPDAKVSFAFDGRLHLFVDVRTIEEIVAAELILPGLGGGMFHEIQRSQAPRHGFGHRLTALVNR